MTPSPLLSPTRPPPAVLANHPSGLSTPGSSHIPATTLSPILAKSPTGANLPAQPQFAELLTPARLRKKRRHAPQVVVPQGMPTQVGPSRGGYFTTEGDLFRGATQDPTIPTMSRLEEDAVTIGGSSTTSSSSSWSWGSGNLERGRRATMAVIGRFGEALGVRRGSETTDSETDTSDDEHDRKSMRSKGTTRRRRRSFSNRLSRTISRSTVDSSPDRPKRQHVPKRREFTLLVPPTGSPHAGPSIMIPSPSTPGPSAISPTPAAPSHVSERVVTTPLLPDVLKRIRELRLASGMLSTETPPHTPAELAPRRGGSAPGHRRGPHRAGATSFLHPPVPVRPLAARAQTRVEELRAADVPVRPKSVSDLMGLANPYASNTSLPSFKQGEGEASASKTPSPPVPHPVDPKGKGKAKECWWLDVSCPGWEDLRDIGELLSLHPLTLEDVLQQDPREKLDMFEKLGYYFVVVRALDESYFKYTPGSPNNSVPAMAQPTPTPSVQASPDLAEQSAAKKEGRRRGWGMGRAVGKLAARTEEKVEIVEDNPGKEGLEGVGVGAVNVYLVVFADGIVSFHFEDISKHTKRVLDRILSEAGGDHTSDWVAHGILDSIVDAFFPLCRFVDSEVDDIDSLTVDPSTDPRAVSTSPTASPISSAASSTEDGLELSEKIELDKSGGPSPPDAVKVWRHPTPPPKTSWTQRFRQRIPHPRIRVHLPLPLLYLYLFFLPTASAVKHKHHKIAEAVFDRSTMLRRITDTRRLVTGLTRLLGAKHQVIGRLKRRAAEKDRGVEVYFGDVEDHVLLLQTSLYHYEYILAHCQPAYLSYINTTFAYTRGMTDEVILAFSVVAFSVLPMQFVIGMFSMNVIVPHNGEWANPHSEPDGSVAPWNYFAGVVIGIFFVACGMVSLIRYWRSAARRKFAESRGMEKPDLWDAYWGWQ